MPAWTFSPALMPPQGDRLGHLEFLYPERHGLAHHWRTNILMALFQIAPFGRMAEDKKPGPAQGGPDQNGQDTGHVQVLGDQESPTKPVPSRHCVLTPPHPGHGVTPPDGAGQVSLHLQRREGGCQGNQECRVPLPLSL